MGIIAGVIVPHPPIAVPEIGKGEERAIQRTLDSYREAAEFIARMEPETIVLTSPHSMMYQDYFHISPGKGARGSFARFRAPQVQISAEYDEELAEEIDRVAAHAHFPAGTMGEMAASLDTDHGTTVPLYFINQCYKNYKLVRIGLSGLDLNLHMRFGELISEVCDKLGRKVVFVASGDLSHCQKKDGPYGLSPEGPEYDEKLMQVLESGDLSKLLKFDEGFLEKAQECGHRSFCIMYGAIKDKKIEHKVLSHEATFGVGYGFATFEVKGSIKVEEKVNKEEDPYVALARKSVESYVKTGKYYEPESIPEEMEQKRAGAFVSIHERGLLRGCIGTIAPVQQNVAWEIIENAVSASTRDPRFDPIGPEELDALEINVDILSEAEPVASPAELDVKRYGVIVQKGMRRGLLLPDLDGVDTVEQQLSIAKQKAGISIYDEDVDLFRFEVVRHE